MPQTILQTDLPLPNRRQGKVRDIYDATSINGQPGLLIIASDRISAFDVVMPNGIPGKGIVLTQISRFWFEMVEQKLKGELDHHILSFDPSDVAGLDDAQRESLKGRIMLGRKCNVVPIECIVRGYIAGSGWKEYQKSQTVCGIKLPSGLQQCDKLPEPIFTPSTKAETGHDENISFEEACNVVDRATMEHLSNMSLTLYQLAHDYARERGIILADTKFEFGIPVDEPNAKPILIDEVLTPDSSRFWPADDYQPGRDQASYDKQYVRNYLQELVDADSWHKAPPAPELPDNIVTNTLAKYIQAYESLTGQKLNL